MKLDDHIALRAAIGRAIKAIDAVRAAFPAGADGSLLYALDLCLSRARKNLERADARVLRTLP